MLGGSGVAGAAVYRRAFARWMGEGSFQAFKGLDIANADFTKLGKGAGERFEYRGNIFRLVRARGALTAGGIVKLYTNAAARVSTLTVASTTANLVTDDTFVAGDLVGGNVFIKSGTGVGQLREILGNDAAVGASSLVIARYDSSLNKAATSSPDALAVAVDGTSTTSVVCSWEVVETAAATDYVVGVSLGAVASGNWTIIQEKGYALVKCVGSTDALTANGPLVPSGTAGTAKGFTTAGETAAEARLSFGMALDAYSGAADLRHALIWGRYQA